MKRLRYLVAALCILSSGCIKVDMALNLRENGAGTMEVSYSVSEQAITQMEGMLRLKQQIDSATGKTLPPSSVDAITSLYFNPDQDKLTKELKKYEKNGIKVDKMKVESRNNWRYVSLKLSFENLEQAAKADFFPEYGFTIFKNQAGNYVFYRASESKGATPIDFSNQSNLNMLTPLLAGFNVIIKLTLPGQILETNAHNKTDRTAMWVYDFDRTPADFAALNTQNLRVTFDGRGVKIPEVKQTRSSAFANASGAQPGPKSR